MNDFSQDVDSRPGGSSIRVSGKFYSIESLVAAASNQESSPSNVERGFSRILYIILFIAVSVSGHSLGGFWGLFLSLAIHEAGHWLGMLLVGWSKVEFGMSFCGPIALSKEDISAGRKATVALSGPAMGLGAAMICSALGSAGNGAFLQQLSHALYFVSFLNLLPIKPFDGYTVVEHLLFIRHPKLEMFYLGISGVVLVIFAFRRMDMPYPPTQFPFLGFFFGTYGMAMFRGIKKVDNMADMITQLRREGAADFNTGRYSLRTIKQMEFWFELFDIREEFSMTALLREIWDRAWEVPPSWIELLFVIAMYTLLVMSFLMSGTARVALGSILRVLGVDGI